ncbi:MAG: hypothetical protein ACOYMB_03540 [Patescibacteria group bacterium]
MDAKIKYREDKDFIYLSVTSDGMTGEDWVNLFKISGRIIDDNLKHVLLSSGFKPTSGVTTEIAVFKGRVFVGGTQTAKNIREEAEVKKLFVPNPEVACLALVNLPDQALEDLGLDQIIIFHEPIKDSEGDLVLLGISSARGEPRLCMYFGGSDHVYRSCGGIAFASSQTGL